MKGQTRRMAGVVGILVILLLAGGVFAKIPEPDNIIYGLATDSVVIVQLKVNDKQIASYTMGTNPNADGYYILRVPMDSMDPPQEDAARTGDIAMIYLNGASEPLGSVTLGERGAVYRLDLEFTDVDEDGLPDSWEIANFGNLSHDGNADSDGDGETDAAEYANGTDPNDPMSMYAGNLDGDMYITLEDAIIALKVVTGVDTGGITIDKDAAVKGDSKIGTQDASFILQKVSGARE